MGIVDFVAFTAFIRQDVFVPPPQHAGSHTPQQHPLRSGLEARNVRVTALLTLKPAIHFITAALTEANPTLLICS